MTSKIKPWVHLAAAFTFAALALTACGGSGSTAAQPQVAIVVGETKNAFQVSVNDPRLKAVAMSLARDNAKVTLVSAGGSPQVVASMNLASTGQNSLIKSLQVKQNAKKLLAAISKVTPTGPQANPLGAYDLAVRQLGSTTGQKDLYMLDSGLQTVAPIPEQMGGILEAGNVSQIVSFVEKEGELAPAAGVAVTWLDLGAVSGSQPELSQAEYQSLASLWKGLISASGASSVTISTTQLITSKPPQSWPTVSVVPVSLPASFHGASYSTAGIRLSLPKATFASGSASLTPSAISTLKQDLQVVSEYPHSSLLIEGYTDSVPDPAGGNYQLGLNRVDSVRAWLISNGIAPTRISVKSYGASDPVASNATAQGRAQNRRTDILIES